MATLAELGSCDHPVNSNPPRPFCQPRRRTVLLPPAPAQGADGRTPSSSVKTSRSPQLGASSCVDKKPGSARQQEFWFPQKMGLPGFAAMLCGKSSPQRVRTDRLPVARRVLLIQITWPSFFQKLLGLVALVLRSALDKIMCFF